MVSKPILIELLCSALYVHESQYLVVVLIFSCGL
jgi:hypothetical protein